MTYYYDDKDLKKVKIKFITNWDNPHIFYVCESFNEKCIHNHDDECLHGGECTAKLGPIKEVKE